jgi:hypothetical protein
LRWVCKSTRVLAAELGGQRHPISHVKLAQLLHQQHYSLQGTRKTEEGADHPDRDAAMPRAYRWCSIPASTSRGSPSSIPWLKLSAHSAAAAWMP